MANAAISNPQPITGLSVPIWKGLEDASQSWVAGAVLVAASSGEIAEGGNGAITDIVGIACNDATTTTGSVVEYIPALPWMMFEANLDSEGGTPLTSLATHQFGPYATFQEAASGFHYIDVDAANNVRVLEFVDVVGTAQARVKFIFLRHATIFDLSQP